MKLFEKILMASEDVQAYLVSGRNDAEEMFDGAFVEIGDLCDHEAYGSYVAGMKDMNTRVVRLGLNHEGNLRYGIVDHVGVSEADVMNVKYRVGSKTADLPVLKGTPTRVRIPQVGDEFFLGDENIAEATIAAGDFLYAGTDGRFIKTKATGASLKLKVEFGTDKITGAVNNGKKYFCTVVAV